jgi:hypothetical protein
LNQLNLQIKASLSHWKSKRDEAQSNLDIYLNKSCANGSDDNIQEKINKLFEDFAYAQNVVLSIEKIIENLVTDEPEQTPDNK